MTHRQHLTRVCALVSVALLAGDAAAGRGAEQGALAPPRNEVLDRALQAYACARAEGAVQRPVLAVIDYTLPSTERRLWLIDPDSGRVQRRELVAHGKGSGGLRATHFSNEPGSHRSSLGLFVTGETYIGRHGRSLRLHGLEPGVNDAAYDRAIVVHAASYATQAHAVRFGRLGRSHGCPALAPDVAPELLDTLENGAALFVYGDDPDWLGRGRDLRCGSEAQPTHALGFSTPIHAPAGSSASRASSFASRP